jgi:hypothetical protein
MLSVALLIPEFVCPESMFALLKTISNVIYALQASSEYQVTDYMLFGLL